jgi:hypothetical protein
MWVTETTAIGGYGRETIIGERPMRWEMSAGPAYVALILAAVAALLSAPDGKAILNLETQQVLAGSAPKLDAIARAMAENPSAMIPP